MATLSCESYEKKFKDVTLPPFVSGMSSIVSFVNSAVTFGDKELEESEIGKVKVDIELANREMRRAEKEARDVIDSMTAETLQLADDFDKAQRERKEQEESLWIKKDELIILESRRYQANDQLQAARSSLQHMETALNSAEARKGDKITGRDMGIGLIFLAPCVGIPMTVNYNKELNTTKKLVKTVDGEINHLRAEVKQREDEMHKYNSQIPEKSKEIERLKESVARKEREVEKLQRACGLLADTKCKLKYCYNYLYSLQGAVEVLYNSCQDLYSLDPIMPIIEETLKAIQQQNSHNELLAYDEEVQKKVKELKMIQYRMNMK
ncbi:uncharacterized protein LOC132819620 [Hemiscyllium ocellatum]|uniref:uncharacterized protein LOC132819620 n=1 Tax=Hemiscyllium ocellatum TaxID=170820 RepID=UPI002966E94A|nr:uncharacterized protein LOC132819620 [Hemiscyllium ocellatum]